MSRAAMTFTDDDLDAVLGGPGANAAAPLTFNDADLDAVLGTSAPAIPGTGTRTTGFATVPHDEGEPWGPPSPDLRGNLDAGSMLNPMNYVAGVPDAAKGLVRSVGTTIGGMAQAVPEVGAYLSEGIGGAEAVTKLKIAKALRGVGAGEMADRLEADAMTVLDNTFAASRGMRQEGQGVTDWGRQVSTGARSDPNLQYSPQAQQGLEAMQRGESWLPTTAQGIMAMGGESGVPTLAALGGAVVGGPAGAMVAGGVAAAGNAYDQSLQTLLNDPAWSNRPVNEVKAEAARRAVQSGIVEGGTGAIPVDEALAGPVARRLLSPGAGRVQSGAVRGATGMVEEAVQGGTAEAMGAVGDRATGDAQAFNNLPERVLRAAVAEGVIGLGPGAVGGFVSPGGVQMEGRADGVQDAQLPAPAAIAQRGNVESAAQVATGVPVGDAGAAGAVEQAQPGVRVPPAAVDALTNPAATEAEVLAALQELESAASAAESPDQGLPVSEQLVPQTVADTASSALAGTPDLQPVQEVPEGAHPDLLAQAEQRVRGVQEVEAGASSSPNVTPLPPADDAIAAQAVEVAAQSEQGVKQPTTLAEWQAAARRLGVSPKGPLGLVQRRVRAAQATATPSPSRVEPATPSVVAAPEAIVGAAPESRPGMEASAAQSASPTVPTAGRESEATPQEQLRSKLSEYDDAGLETLVTKAKNGIEWQRGKDREELKVALREIEKEQRRRKAEKAKSLTDDEWLAQTRFYRSGATKNAELPNGQVVILKKDATPSNFREQSRDFLLSTRDRSTPTVNLTPTSPAATPDASGSGGTGASQTKPTRAGKRPSPRPASPGVEKGSTSGKNSEPWQQTRAAYIDAGRADPNFDVDRWGDAHETAVAGAIRRGNPVPESVKADYPALVQRIAAEEADTTDHAANIRKAKPKSDPRRRGAVAFPAGDDATKRADTIATMERRAAKKAAAALEAEQSAHDKTRARKEDFRERAKGDIALLKGLIRAEASRVKGMTEARDRALSALAREAVRADNTENALREKIGDLQEDAAFKDALAKERSKAQTILLRAMADILPRSEWGTYTRRVADVKTASQAYKLAEDMQRQAVILDAKDLATRVARVTGVRDIRDLDKPEVRQKAVDRGRLRLLSGNEGEKELARKALYDFAELGAKFDQLMDNAGSAQEMQDVVNALEATYQRVVGAVHQRRMENKLISKNGAQAAQGARDLVESSVRKRDALSRNKANAPEADKLSVLARSQLDAENALLLLDDDRMTTTGTATRIFQDVRTGRNNAAARTERLMEEVNQIAKDAGFKDWGEARAKISGTLGDASQETVKLEKAIGGRKEITLAEALYLYGIDPQTQQRTFIKNRPWSWDGNRSEKWVLGWQEYDALRRAIPENLRVMLDRMKLVTEKNRPEMMETLRMLNGFEPPTVPGYLKTKANPVFYRPEEAPRTFNADTVTYLENMGLTKEREPSAGIPLLVLDALDAIESAITDSSRIIELAPALRNARAVLASQQVRAAVDQHIGKDLNEHLDLILAHAAGNVPPSSKRFDRIIRWLVSNTARGLVQVNPRSWLKNMGGVYKATSEVPIQVILDGLPSMFSPSVEAEMRAASPYLQERYSASPVAVLSGIQQKGVPYSKSTVIEAAGKSIAAGEVLPLLTKQIPALTDHIRVSLFFDAVTPRVLWTGFSKVAAKEGRSQEWVAEQVENAVRRTQNSADPLDVSRLALSNRESALGAMILSLSSDGNRSFNMLYRAKRQGRRQLVRASTAVALSAAWSAAVGTMLGDDMLQYAMGALTGADDEKQRERLMAAWHNAGKAFLADMAGSTVIGDDVVSTIDAAFGGNPMSAGISTPLGSTVARTIRGGVNLGRSAAAVAKAPDRQRQDEAMERLYKASMDLALGTSTLLGISVEPAARMTHSVIKGAETGKTRLKSMQEDARGKPDNQQAITDARRRLYDGMATGSDEQVRRAFAELKDSGIRLSRSDLEALVESRDPFRGMKPRERREYLRRLDADPEAKAEHEKRVQEWRVATRSILRALRAQRQ